MIMKHFTVRISVMISGKESGASIAKRIEIIDKTRCMNSMMMEVNIWNLAEWR